MEHRWYCLICFTVNPIILFSSISCFEELDYFYSTHLQKAAILKLHLKCHILEFWCNRIKVDWGSDWKLNWGLKRGLNLIFIFFSFKPWYDLRLNHDLIRFKKWILVGDIHITCENFAPNRCCSVRGTQLKKYEVKVMQTLVKSCTCYSSVHRFYSVFICVALQPVWYDIM